MDVGALLEGLTVAQQEAVTSDAAPLCVLAGAGAGKTRVLTRRIAHRVVTGTADPSKVLALTFTRRAAGELRHRLTGLGVPVGVAAGTFHGVAFAQLRQRWADQRRRPLTVVASRRRLLAPMLGPATDPAVQTRTDATALEIAWAKARLVTPDQYRAAATQAGRHPILGVAVVAEVYARYEVDMHRRGVLDLDDLVIRCADTLEEDEDFRDAQRWRWRHFFVDEYQDLNPSSARLLSQWLGPRLDLCAVGDPHQAIYGWNGADPTLLDRFADDHPSAGVVSLEDNFRSSPEIVAVAGAVLRRPGAPTRGTAHQGTAQGGAVRQPNGPVPTVASFADDAEEARAVARAVRDLHAPGNAWSRVAVLARTNARLDVLASALGDAAIPYRLQGGRPLARVAGVSDLLVGARAASFASALRTDARAERTHEGDPERRERLRALVEAIDQYLDLDRDGTVETFRSWLDTTERVYEGPAGDAVCLSTFHRAKGLEWPAVFVCGLEDGLVPLGHRVQPDVLAEERRLLYVALTRAQTELRCSWAERCRVGTRLAARRPSPLLAAAQDAVATLAGRAADRPADGAARVRAMRDRLTAAHESRPAPAA
jgi:DNA helicase-2/ATP-dependent DNA helicase PcrA